MLALLMTAVSVCGFLAARSFWSIIPVFIVYSIFLVSLSPLIDTLTLTISKKTMAVSVCGALSAMAPECSSAEYLKSGFLDSGILSYKAS